MGMANDQIRVSSRVKRELQKRKRAGESYNDVLERVFDEKRKADFYDGFGMLSDEQAKRIRDQREEGTEKRKERMKRLNGENG